MKKSTLGESIARFRRQAGITQEELGRGVGVTTQAVSRWECGGTPDVELLPAIADRLHVSVDALFGRDGAAPNPKTFPTQMTVQLDSGLLYYGLVEDLRAGQL